MSKADERHDITVDQYIDSLEDDLLKKDTQELYGLMHKISGKDSILYGYGTIGFGVYKYHYESGRKGEAHTLAFYPRKGKITVYLMDGTARYGEHLAKLGKHSITGYCIYFKRLSDVDVSVLTQILRQSYQNITSLSKDSPIDHILWQG